MLDWQQRIEKELVNFLKLAVKKRVIEYDTSRDGIPLIGAVSCGNVLPATALAALTVCTQPQGSLLELVYRRL